MFVPIIAVYAASVYGAKQFIKEAFLKPNSPFEDEDITNVDRSLIYVPIINTLMSVVGICMHYNKSFLRPKKNSDET